MGLPLTRLDRDSFFGALFGIPAIVVVSYVLGRQPPTAAFWICCVLATIGLLGTRQKSAAIGAAALYAIGPLAVYAAYTRRRDAIVGMIICVAVLGGVIWFGERPTRLKRHAFAEGRYCPNCNRALQAKRLHRPLFDGETASESHWFHRCDCGECTLFDPAGNGRLVAMSAEARADLASRARR